MSRRPVLNTTISKKSKATINRVSRKFDDKINAGVDHICLTYEENKDVLEDPEAVQVARAYISERNKKLCQSNQL
nr:hypothetical protein [uncultured Methanolobus sp.]